MSRDADARSVNPAACRTGSYQELLGHAPYRLRRRVRWSDCDPGNIVYTPNFLDYAIETAESWFEATMGIHWSRIAPELGLGHPYVRCELDFRKMLCCGDAFVMSLKVASIGRSSYALGISGDDEGGDRCFDARLVAAWVSAKTQSAIAIPEEFRKRLEIYASTGDCGPVRGGA